MALAALSMIAACHKTDKISSEEQEQRMTNYYVNAFAYNMMSTYYLWVEEISDAMSKWKVYDEPKSKIAEIRYKDSAGKDIDRWTMISDNIGDFLGSVTGNTKTYGMDIALYRLKADSDEIVAVVRFTYAGSPAAEAGIKRGDVITKVNGKAITMNNYLDLVPDELLGGDNVILTLHDGRTVSLVSVNMYENPVGPYTVFEHGGRKIGYLHFSGFTLDACDDLIEVCRKFKEEGIEELVLDLRYNGGGYVFTEGVLASMIAPESAVTAKEVFSTEVYNKTLTDAWGKEETRFDTSFTLNDEGERREYSTAGANLGLSRLWVITSSGSASASESLLCCLKPYMNITIVGEQTHGKYCGGIITEAVKWYEAVKDDLDSELYENGKEAVKGWGIYVMISRYADKDGVTISMPDGIAPDYPCEDDPTEKAQLGDPSEKMLSTVLALMDGNVEEATKSSLRPVPELIPTEKFNARILNGTPLAGHPVVKPL